MPRYDLTDFEWSTIEPVLPQKSRGVSRVDDRRILNGIFCVLRSGTPWADFPRRYGLPTFCFIVSAAGRRTMSGTVAR